MPPSAGKNLDYLLPLIHKRSTIDGLLLKPGSTYPDGTPVGEPFFRVPVSKGRRIATFWRYRTEGTNKIDEFKVEHPHDSGKSIATWGANYEKVPVPLTRWALITGLDEQREPGDSEPEGYVEEVGAGLRDMTYAVHEHVVASNLLNTANYNAVLAPAPGGAVNCVATPWSNALINPFNDAASGLVTAVAAMTATGKYPSGLILGAAEWAALVANPLAQTYLTANTLINLSERGKGQQIPIQSVGYAITIPPFPAINIYVGLAAWDVTMDVNGNDLPANKEALWSGALLFCKDQVIGGRPNGQHFCFVADGGDEFRLGPDGVGFKEITEWYRFILNSTHFVCDWNNATLLYNLV